MCKFLRGANGDYTALRIVT